MRQRVPKANQGKL